jgi:tetratricopeptide (TPR) repeat protein
MKNLLLILGLMLSFVSFSQTEKEKLAAHYYSEGDFTKAGELYRDLARRTPSSPYYYESYLNCLFELKEFKTASKLVDRRIKKFPLVFNYKVDKGYVLKKKGESSKADAVYTRLIKDIVADPQRIESLATAFMKRNELKWAISAYEKGRKKLSSEVVFTLELAPLYLQMDQNEKVISEFLTLLVYNESYYTDVKTQILSFANSKDMATLQRLTMKRIQKNPNSMILNDLLMWTFIQRRDWESAFIQTRAIDKKLKENGERMISLGAVCTSNREYKWAAKCYEYIVSLKESSGFYTEALRGLLDNRFLQLEEEGTLPADELEKLEKDLKSFIEQYRSISVTVSVKRKLAKLYAYYLHEEKKAIVILEELKDNFGVTARMRAMIKLELADIYLASGDMWEPSLLYSQVEKDFKEDAMGQEAKFRNARLAYFRGEFEWAQTQLNVLKAATTQLISNNAIRLSLFITDNLGLDSTEQPMILYSRAELYVFQNKLDDAIKELEAISIIYPNHDLEDDILFLMGKISEKQRKWTEAIGYYNKVAQNFYYDILADNALFNIGDIYQFRLKDLEKAQETYEKIILDYSSSMFVVEARKRYRSLKPALDLRP